MMHSQELRKVFFCLKKNPSAHSKLPLLQEQTLLCVYLIDGQVVTLPIKIAIIHSEGISQMISYHVLNFSPQKVSHF